MFDQGPSAVVACAQCGTNTQKPTKEMRRSLKLGRFLFCSSHCGAAFHNASRKARDVVLCCPGCGKAFTSTTKARAAKHCSRACASKNSVTEVRREAARLSGLANQRNLLSLDEVMRRREAWKYSLLTPILEAAHRKFEFEFRLGKFLYDLALHDTRVLVEFDGYYHQDARQQHTDRLKEKAAQQAGYSVVRRTVVTAAVIDPVALQGL